MKYGILFLILGSILGVEAVMLRGFYWILAWPGLSFAMVGAAYLGLGPSVLGKRPNGTMAWYAVTPLLPYLLLTWLTWHAVRLVSGEECCNEIVPELFIGRRPLAHELPENVTLVVDLTAEFAEAGGVRSGRHYLAFPMLDTGVPSVDNFEQLVRQITDWQGAAYIHCAQGHGRTGLVAAAELMAKGKAATAEEAVAVLAKARPRLALGKNQLAFLNRVGTPDAREAARSNTTHF
jgi:protein-tyrosine phosphatase